MSLSFWSSIPYPQLLCLHRHYPLFALRLPTLKFVRSGVKSSLSPCVPKTGLSGGKTIRRQVAVARTRRIQLRASFFPRKKERLKQFLQKGAREFISWLVKETYSSLEYGIIDRFLCGTLWFPSPELSLNCRLSILILSFKFICYSGLNLVSVIRV